MRLAALPGWESLLGAYLRADEAYTWSEEIVLAECLLLMVTPAKLPRILARLHQNKLERAKAQNRKALWMAMRLLNEKMKRYTATDYQGLVDDVMAPVG